MKKFYYLIAMAVMAFTFTSCEDVPEPYGQPTNPNSTTSVDPAGTGTADNPFNVAAAIAKCKEIGNTVSSEKYYIKGYAASAATADAQYGNVSFDMTDSKDGKGKKFKAYQVAGTDGQKLTEGYTINIGDEILLYGPIYNYNNSTPETAGKAAAYIVTVNGQKTNGGNGGDTPQPTGDNLLTNGDFETWTGGQPENWKTASSAGNATLTQSTDARGGSYSVSVGFNATSNKRLAYKELTLKAGTYTFSFYAKATTADKSQTEAGYVPVTNGTAGQYKYGGYVSLNNTEWTLVSTTFTLEATTTVALVMMNPKNSDYCVAQNILVDDASLVTSDGGIDESGNTGGEGGQTANHGTAEAPLTVAQAIALIDAESNISEAYVKGKISQIDSYNDKYKSITYWISDDGTTTTQLQVYSGKGLNGADFASKDDLTVGKTVVIKGALKKYNSTYEFDKTSSIISID